MLKRGKIANIVHLMDGKKVAEHIDEQGEHPLETCPTTQRNYAARNKL